MNIQMVRLQEIERFADDGEAQEHADRDGKWPAIEAPFAAILAAIGVYFVLMLFALLTMPDNEAALWPIIAIAAICGIGVWAIQWWREIAWLKRYRTIQGRRRRRTEMSR